MGITIAYSIGNTFRSEYIPQQPLTGISRYSRSPIYPSWHAIDDRINQSSLAQGKVLKIQELKGLMNKYPQYCPDGIIKLAIFRPSRSVFDSFRVDGSGVVFFGNVLPNLINGRRCCRTSMLT